MDMRNNHVALVHTQAHVHARDECQMSSLAPHFAYNGVGVVRSTLALCLRGRLASADQVAATLGGSVPVMAHWFELSGKEAPADGGDDAAVYVINIYKVKLSSLEDKIAVLNVQVP